MYAFLADALVCAHFLVVAFSVAGEATILAGAALGWKWIRNLPFRLLHLALVLYVAGESVFGVVCPLTEWEYLLRTAAGQGSERDLSFVARIIRSVIFYDFPPEFFTALYVGFGLLILLTFVLVRPIRKRREG